jgi:uncharacterized repeat protein (TIGR02543 family)
VSIAIVLPSGDYCIANIEYFIAIHSSKKGADMRIPFTRRPHKNHAAGTGFRRAFFAVVLAAIPLFAQTTDLALNKPAIASSEENAGTKAALAVDGNAATRWASAFSDPQWIRIDLGAASSITKVILLWEAASAKNYTVDISNDTVAWTPLATKTGMASGARKDTLKNLAGSGRYIRMYGTARTTGYGYSLFSLEVYGGSNGYTLTTAVSPVNSGTITLNPPNGPYSSGTVVTATAAANTGYTFSSWSGDASGSTPSVQVTMTGNKSITANFSPVAGTANSNKLSISGELFDQAGNRLGTPTPVTVNVKADIFDAATNGNLLFTETFYAVNGKAVLVNNGYFTVRLGEGTTTGNLQSTITGNNNLWVQLTVDNGTPDVLTPRTPITASAYIVK